MKRALGAPPVRRPVAERSHNLHSVAFDKHRGCNVRSMEFDGDTAQCTECGNKWRIQRDSRGEPVGYTIGARVLVESIAG